MRRGLLLAALSLTGCGERAPSVATENPAATSATVAPLADLPTFDPATIEPGDRVLGLTVVSTDLSRALEDSIWVGSVVFEGDLVLHGVYQQHPDWPQIDLPCVDVVQLPSAGRIPHFPADVYADPDAKTWFCFDDPALALELIGSPEQPREVVVALGRYRAQRDLADAFDTAELAELIEVGPTAAATLRER